MADKPLPTPVRLRQLMRYDPATGRLYWKERSVSYFHDAKYPKREVARWNARYADQEAFTAINRDGYRHGSLAGRQIGAHRVIWAMIYGEWPAASVDHINGDKADNRLSNLREARHQENLCNRGANKTWRGGRRVRSAFCGVSYTQGRWVAGITAGGRRIYLGRFPTEEEAARAYDAAAREHHGEFARLNFPNP